MRRYRWPRRRARMRACRISCCAGRYRTRWRPTAWSGRRANNRLVEAHDAWWASEAEMEEGNPLLILDRGEAAAPLPPAIVVQGSGDDNVTPDMADRFASAYRARGGRLDLHKFAGQPHTFIPRDPASEASRQAVEKLRDFVLKQAEGE